MIKSAVKIYTRLVFFKMRLPNAPRPKANNTPPTIQSITLIIVEFNGVIIETIIKSSIPPPKLPQTESHALCFAATLITVNIETNTSEPYF